MVWVQTGHDLSTLRHVRVPCKYFECRNLGAVYSFHFLILWNWDQHFCTRHILILGMHALWRFHNVSLFVLSASKRLELLAMLFILLCDWTRKPTTTETSTKLICLSFPNLVNSITFGKCMRNLNFQRNCP